MGCGAACVGETVVVVVVNCDVVCILHATTHRQQPQDKPKPFPSPDSGKTNAPRGRERNSSRLGGVNGASVCKGCSAFSHWMAQLRCHRQCPLPFIPNAAPNSEGRSGRPTGSSSPTRAQRREVMSNGTCRLRLHTLTMLRYVDGDDVSVSIMTPIYG